MAQVLIGTATTNASGVATFSNLVPGNYRYVQKTSKTGYTVDATSYNIKVSNATPIFQTRYNSPTVSGTLQINKHVFGNVNQPLSGATFKLTDNMGKTMVATSTPSNSQGLITFSNLMTNAINPVIYRISEVTAPTGYQINRSIYNPVVYTNQTTTQSVPNTPA